MSTFITTDPFRYEKFIRWSQGVAPRFIELAGVRPGERVLDVGCGTGALTVELAAAKVGAVTGIDLSLPYIEYARRRVTGRIVTFEVGDALRLPYPDAAFDRTLSMLALDVFPDATQALAEMRRVTRPGGTVSGLVNDFRCGSTAFSIVWDIAAVLDPRAGVVRDEIMSEAMGWPGGLAAFFQAAGLADVREDQINTRFEYASFEDYWATFLTGQGYIGGYVMTLTDTRRKELERHVRAAYLSGMSDGPRVLTTWFWVVRGDVPNPNPKT